MLLSAAYCSGGMCCSMASVCWKAICEKLQQPVCGNGVSVSLAGVCGRSDGIFCMRLVFLSENHEKAGAPSDGVSHCLQCSFLGNLRCVLLWNVLCSCHSHVSEKRICRIYAAGISGNRDVHGMAGGYGSLRYHRYGDTGSESQKKKPGNTIEALFHKRIDKVIAQQVRRTQNLLNLLFFCVNTFS